MGRLCQKNTACILQWSFGTESLAIYTHHSQIFLSNVYIIYRLFIAYIYIYILYSVYKQLSEKKSEPPKICMNDIHITFCLLLRWGGLMQKCWAVGHRCPQNLRVMANDGPAGFDMCGLASGIYDHRIIPRYSMNQKQFKYDISSSGNQMCNPNNQMLLDRPL